MSVVACVSVCVVGPGWVARMRVSARLCRSQHFIKEALHRACHCWRRRQVAEVAPCKHIVIGKLELRGFHSQHCVCVCSSSSASVERERQTPPEVVQIDKETFVNDITEIHQKFDCTRNWTTHEVRRYKKGNNDKQEVQGL